jgi:hypothetical protein
MEKGKNKVKPTLGKSKPRIVIKDGELAISGSKENLLGYYYFSSYQWVEDLKDAMLFEIEAGGGQRHSNSIALSTISSFKGLESDAVILLLPPTASHFQISDLYVAFSRPRIYLHVLASTLLAKKFARIFSD